jgi:hypothetical protein
LRLGQEERNGYARIGEVSQQRPAGTPKTPDFSNKTAISLAETPQRFAHQRGVTLEPISSQIGTAIRI